MPSGRKDNLTPELLEKEGRVVAMRDEGYTLDEIAAELGYANRGGVSKAYWRALKRYPAERVAEHRAAENIKLDAHEANVEQIEELAINTDDPELALKAIDRSLKIKERRAKLNGLDMPIKSEVDMKGGGFVAVTVPADRLPPKAQRKLAEEADARARAAEGLGDEDA